MSTESPPPTMELPNAPGMSRPKAGTTSIEIDTDALLDQIMKEQDPDAKEHALDQLGVHVQLADNEVVEKVIGDLLAARRTSIDFPFQHLRILFRRNQALRPETVGAVEDFFEHGDSGVRAMAIKVLAKHQNGQTDRVLEATFRCGIDGDLQVQIAVAEAGKFFTERPLRAACNLLALAEDARDERTKTPDQHPVREAAFRSLVEILKIGEGAWVTETLAARADFVLNSARSCPDHWAARDAAEQAFEALKAVPAFQAYATGGAPKAEAPKEEGS